MQKHEEWLLLAQADLKAAIKLIEGEDALVGPAVFHTQQCAEKALKAYLTYKEQPLKKTHDLAVLVRFCQQFDIDFAQLISNATDLNPYLSESRYPDDGYMIPDLTTVKKSIKQAQSILEFVIQRIR